MMYLLTRQYVLVFELQHLKITTEKLEIASKRGKDTVLKSTNLLIQKKTRKEENKNSTKQKGYSIKKKTNLTFKRQIIQPSLLVG